MGYLINAWNETQKKFTMTLKQVVNIAGDESLESEDAVREMRAFFGMIDLPTMERLLKESYSKDKKHKFDARGFAFQDLVNEMGRRLGYDVENGLYRGRRNEVGFDGIWRLPDGSCIIMESKATGDYAFAPDTVIGYREKLISEQRISRKKCSILVVFGRDDKGTLRNAVKGSDEAPNIRLISSNALFQLVRMTVISKTDTPSRQIINLLRPRDYFVLDNLVELVFPETDSEIADIEDEQEDTPGDAGAASISEPSFSAPVITKYDMPSLPDSSMKVGAFVYSAMKGLADSGYVFEEDLLQNLLADGSMHDVLGMQRHLPFLKRFDPKDTSGAYIDGRPRFYRTPLTFGNEQLYINSQLYEKDKARFIAWYEKLAQSAGNSAGKVTVNTDERRVPPLPDRNLKVGKLVRTAMENLAASGYLFTDVEIEKMCSDNWMHDVIGMTRRLPFFKRYDPNESKGNCINGITRFYAKPLVYGKHVVYLTKELFEEDKEPFIIWCC